MIFNIFTIKFSPYSRTYQIRLSKKKKKKMGQKLKQMDCRLRSGFIWECGGRGAQNPESRNSMIVCPLKRIERNTSRR
ncbi:hypothetical protein C5167_029027 [Papaver somniferum]|nr:hypothetical protein C5167_029027 [Papaver somniferum]